MKPVGKPDAGKLHVRFDERGGETERAKAPPRLSSTLLKRQKNDATDAEAICEAVTRANMRFVATKTPEQQSSLVLHRTRHLFIRQRTSVINVILPSCSMRFPVSTRRWPRPVLPVLLIRRSSDWGRNFSVWMGLVRKQRSSRQCSAGWTSIRREWVSVARPLTIRWAPNGAAHFLVKNAAAGCTEMAMHVLAYNFTRVMNVVGIIRW